MPRIVLVLLVALAATASAAEVAPGPLRVATDSSGDAADCDAGTGSARRGVGISVDDGAGSGAGLSASNACNGSGPQREADTTVAFTRATSGGEGPNVIVSFTAVETEGGPGSCQTTAQVAGPVFVLGCLLPGGVPMLPALP